MHNQYIIQENSIYDITDFLEPFRAIFGRIVQAIPVYSLW